MAIIEQVDFYDVGHGNEISLIVNNGKDDRNIIVSDFGDSDNRHTELLENCKKIKQETGRIPHLTGIISHMHSDHKGGLKKLLEHNNKEFIFDKIYIPDTYVKDLTYIKLLEENVNIVKFGNDKEKTELLKYAMLYYDDKKIKELSKNLDDKIIENAAKKSEKYKEKLKKRLTDDKKILETDKTYSTLKEVSKNLKDEGKFLKNLVSKNVEVRPINSLKNEEIYGIKTMFHFPTKDDYRNFFGKKENLESLEKVLSIDTIYQYLQSNNELIVSKNQSNKGVLAKRQAENYLKKCCVPGTASGKKLRDEVTFDNELRYRFIARAISDEKNMQNIFTAFEDETGKRIICPGDMELPQELMLLYNKEKIDLGCNVLVIGHHELLTSSFVSYLERVVEDSKQRGINPEEILVVSFTGGVDLNKIETQEYKDIGTVNAKLYQVGLSPVSRTYKNRIQLIRDENMDFGIITEDKINTYMKNREFKKLEEYTERGEMTIDFLKEHTRNGYEGAEYSTEYEHEQALKERCLNEKEPVYEKECITKNSDYLEFEKKVEEFAEKAANYHKDTKENITKTFSEKFLEEENKHKKALKAETEEKEPSHQKER